MACKVDSSKLLCLIILLTHSCSAIDQHCKDSGGKKRDVLEEWVDGSHLCLCDYPEKYLEDPPPPSQFSPPEPNCRVLGCVDRYTQEIKKPGETMFNLAHNVICTCEKGLDPYMMDQGLPDLYHWQC